jgi:hypothetical protein
VLLDYQSSNIINFREIGPDFRWIDIKTFQWSGSASPLTLLTALLAHPWYDDDYASPSGNLPDTPPGMHGPYALTAITPQSFRKVSARECIATFTKWANQLGPLPASFVAKHQSAAKALTGDATAIYQLSDLGPEAQHPWGHHMRSFGFLEFVFVSKRTKTLSLLVASDD